MSEKPNILIFIPDALPRALTDANHPCLTPNLDALARRGVRFMRAHCPSPISSPSRASLMTGQLPHNHGVLQVEHVVDNDQCVLRDRTHFAQQLSKAGYRTGYFGKWHVERTDKLEDFGWQVNGCDSASAVRGIGSAESGAEKILDPDDFQVYEEGPEGYKPILQYGISKKKPQERRIGKIVANGQKFIGEALDSGDPWACAISFTEPNTPTICGQEAYDKYDVDAIELPSHWQDDHQGRPGLYQRAREVYAELPAQRWKELRACYYGLVHEIDALVGQVLKQIDEAGELENTIVLFTSDHGRYLGAHGLDAHNIGAYEEIYNIPLIAAGPGIAQGQTTQALASFMDLGPTLLELAGADPLPDADARSLAPVLKNPQAAEKDFDTGYAEFHGNRFLLTQRILWKGHWKFVFNAFDYDELYNLDADPLELHNRSRDADCQDLVKELMAEVWHIAKKSGDHSILGTHYSPYRFAAVGPDAAKKS